MRTAAPYSLREMENFSGGGADFCSPVQFIDNLNMPLYTRSLAAAVLVAALTVGAAGCSASLTAPTNSAQYSQIDLVVGSGGKAANGDALVVTYTGWFYDSSQKDGKGAQFDAATSTVFTFTLGQGQVIKGWDQGLVGLEVGGQRRLVIPPTLAYGATRHGVIPPNATLLFEITLVGNSSHS